MRLIHLIIFAGFLLSNSCSSSDDKSGSKVNTYTLQPIGEKTFFMDSLTTPDKAWFSFYGENNKNRKLYLLSRLDQSLQTYDWDKGKLLTKVKLPVEGPEGVGRPFSLFVQAPDSIFLLSPYDFRVSLINSKGHVLKRYSLFMNGAVDAKRQNGVLPLSNYASQLNVINGKLLTGAIPNDNSSDQTFYSKGLLGLSLDLKTGNVESLMAMPSKFADIYKEGYAFSGQQLYFGQTYNVEQNLAVINIPTENEVYTVNLNTKAVKPFPAQSSFFKKIEYGKKELMSDMHKEYEYFAMQPNYPAIYYDPYRKLYLRFAGVPNPEKTDPYSVDDDKYFLNNSVLILDKDFHKLGETKLSKDYWQASGFITEEGFYLRKHINDETKLVYSIFKPILNNEKSK